ncbi:LuxR family transcriptional regulator [Actinoplanes philippinensis]|uniref:Predicted ATPase n=1 Tax=Actinoplanes philippinensis TaxID=35752 RepID=A0A1I2D2B7_9ACTN|nr:AAA family ATPase [Actinoplanes philippinensis]GIE74530.1 LuxR family transcriptional regulator [Actinoplanes philippinensis]SFE74625.1 Predicted ATPase [Actinoplanes philippinensis]
MELWERGDALAQLDELVRESRRSGRVALVAGEAGIGKSTLVAAFTRRCGPRARVLQGVCDPLVTPRALGPVHDIGRQVGGRLAERLGAGADRGEVLAALLDELSGPRARPLPVVIVEDAHWADEATTDLLVFLSRRIGRLAAMLVVTFRDDEVGPEHPLRVALAAMPREVVRRIPLPPLSEACVAEQAAHLGRDAAELFHLTGGNPLLVTELLAATPTTAEASRAGTPPESGTEVGQRSPAAVQDLVLARLRGLPEPARALARLVAVIPTRAEAAILGGRLREVQQCLDSGVLTRSGDGVAYRHELLRRVVEESLSPVARVALHREALDLLERAGDVDPARLAHHARPAGDRAAVLRHGTAAAVRAAGQGAHREAAAHYRAMLAYVSGLPPAEGAKLLEAYAVQAYLSGVAAEGLPACRDALRVWRGLGDRERTGDCLRWISRLAWWSGRGAEAREAAAEAVAVLEPGPPGRPLAMAYSNRSQLHMLAYEPDAAVEWGERARKLAADLGDTETELHARVNMASARMLSGDHAAAGQLRHLHREASAAGLTDHAARALVNLASALIEQSTTTDAPAAVEEALGYAVEHDLEGYVQYLLGLRAMIRFAAWDWAGALTDAEASLSRPSRGGVAVLPALVVRARIRSARGDDRALADLDTAAAHAYGLAELQWTAPVAAARSEYFRLAGDRERATAEALPVYEEAVARGHRWFAAELDRHLRLAGDALVSVPPEVLTALDRVEAVRAAAWLRAELRRQGVTGVPRGPRPATAADEAGLTARQAQVLALLADGLSNADIAARLTLSVKTVEHHVSAVLAKLGVTSRGQAAAAARRRPS